MLIEAVLLEIAHRRVRLRAQQAHISHPALVLLVPLERRLPSAGVAADSAEERPIDVSLGPVAYADVQIVLVDRSRLAVDELAKVLQPHVADHRVAVQILQSVVAVGTAKVPALVAAHEVVRQETLVMKRLAAAVARVSTPTRSAWNREAERKIVGACVDLSVWYDVCQVGEER